MKVTKKLSLVDECCLADTDTHQGAGKTTLLNALSGRATYARVAGEVTLNGRGLTSDDLDYVPQFDDLNEYFTPRELLTYINTLKVSLSIDGAKHYIHMSAVGHPGLSGEALGDEIAVRKEEEEELIVPLWIPEAKAHKSQSCFIPSNRVFMRYLPIALRVDRL